MSVDLKESRTLRLMNMRDEASITAIRKKGFGALEEDIFSLVELERASYHGNV